MQLQQHTWRPGVGWIGARPTTNERAQLLLVFGGRAQLAELAPLGELRAAYPNAALVGCSTAGEIAGTEVLDDSLVATVIELERSAVSVHSVDTQHGEDSAEVGAALAELIDLGDLAHVFVLSDGLEVNGSRLVEGLVGGLPHDVTVTGGLSGDGARFAETWVLGEDGPKPRRVTAVALHGAALEVGCASLGGWDTFGPERVVTRSRGNVLYELGGRSALSLYREYLGPEAAAGLPATGLLFPLAVRLSEHTPPVVRTILGIDEAAESLTFAGDIPEGAYARLMRANFDRLVDGAAGAAKSSCDGVRDSNPDLAILISCVGRKMVLQQRVEEEVEAVRDVLGTKTCLTGFYSYGEISPFVSGTQCTLHNQTMTITTITER